MNENTNLVLISGKSTTGKSFSLRNLKEPSGVMYLNTESNKKLPFKSGFQEFTITDPMQVYEAFNAAETKPDVHTIVVDSLTFLMDMYESVYVIPSPDGRKAWGDYAQFFKNLMSQYVAKSSKNVIFTAHTLDIYNETEQSVDTLVKVKGSLMNTGVESFFSTVISTKREPIKKLKNYTNDLLTYNDREENLGVKYVFQPLLTKETINERMRGPHLMWDDSETFINNDLQSVIDRLHEFYD